MCGIAGGLFWGASVTPTTARAAVAAMVTRQSHRGPDGSGIHASAAVDPQGQALAVLGHTRLAIIDVSDAGAQPMGGPGSKPWVVYNGETYNFRDLREELEREGAVFHSRSDTEVILRGYETWGMGVLERLRGMFAFAIWDPRRGRLLIARDRLGIKPVYFYRGDQYLLFASEVRALLATDLVPRALDVTALWHYLGYQTVPAPRTLVAGVQALEPASWLAVSDAGRVETGRYWHMLDAAARDEHVADSEATRRVGEMLREVVAAHLVSDVPVGAFLSGGIDSSAVVALMAGTGCRPRTFSVGFDERTFDESDHAALVARTFGADHTHVPLSGGEMLAELPSALAAMDQPTGDGVNTYVVSRAVRTRGIKVALSGLGGDEIFGGYPSFARLSRIGPLGQVWSAAPVPVRQLAASAVRAIGGHSVRSSKAASMVATDGRVASVYPVLRQVWSTSQRLALLPAALVGAVEERDDPYERLLDTAFGEHPDVSRFAHVSFAEARTYMHDVLLRDTDQMSMAHGLEVRVPLLDHRLVDLVTALPARVKIGGSIPKPLLVASLDKLLPESIVRRRKQGFTLPFDTWMRGPLRAFCEERLGERGLVGRGLVESSAATRMWQSFLRGGPDVSWSRLWTLVVLDAWLTHNPLDVREVA